MDEWRYIEELDKMKEWDTDALCETLNITPDEILEVNRFLKRAINWIKENCE